MAIPLYIVIPDDMGSNIKEGSTVLNALAGDVNHWVAGIARGTGYTGLMYPKAAVGVDFATAPIVNSDEFITTPLYVKQFVAAALAALPAGTDTKVTSITYNAGTRTLRTVQNDGSSWDIVVPHATNTVDGLMKIVQASQIAGAASDDLNAATPSLVSAMIAAAIAGIPAGFDTKVSGFNYNASTRTLQISDNNAGTFNVVLPVGDNAQFGLVKLAIDSMYPAYGASNTLGATPAFVMAAITDALSNLPGDKFLQGLQSYNAATNTMTLLMSDNTTVTVDMTALLNDAIASIPDATAAVRGLVKLATAGMYPSASDTITTTPAYVAAAIAAGAHAPAALANTDGFVTITATGPQAWDINFNLAALPSAGATTRGLVQLATAAEGPVITDETQAATPKYVEDRINSVVPIATGVVHGKVQLAQSLEGMQPSNEFDAATPGYVHAAIANIPNAAGTARGLVQLALAAEGLQPSNEADAATPAYVAGAVAAASHAPVTFTSGNGTIGNYGAGQALDLRVPNATDTQIGVASLAVGANYPATGDAEAVTPAYVSAALAAAGGGTKLIASRQSPLGHIALNLAAGVSQLTDALGFKNGLAFDKTLYPDVNKIVGVASGIVAGGGVSPGSAYLEPATGWPGYAHTSTHWRLWWYLWNSGGSNYQLTPQDTPGSMQVTYGP